MLASQRHNQTLIANFEASLAAVQSLTRHGVRIVAVDLNGHAPVLDIEHPAHTLPLPGQRIGWQCEAGQRYACHSAPFKGATVRWRVKA